MRFADFIVDVAAVLNASRSVASKHVALRARQLDKYKSSSAVVVSLQKHPAGKLVPDTPAGSSGGDDASAINASRPQELEPASGAGPSSLPGQGEANPDILSAADPRPDTSPPHIQNSKRTTVPIDVQRTALRTSSTGHPVPQNGGLSSLGSRSERTFDFKPAPWANPSRIAHQPIQSPVATKLPASEPSRQAGPRNDDSVPPGIDLGVFRTARGAAGLGGSERPSEGGGMAVSKDPVEGSEREAEISPAKAKNPPGDSVSGARASPSQTIPSGLPMDGRQDVDGVSSDGRKPSSSAGSLVEFSPAPHDEPPRQDSDVAGDSLGGSPTTPTYQLRESKVPASRLSRLWNYSGLAAGMFAGAIGESISRAAGGGGQGSVMLSAGNMERLVAKLSRMRGAALKLGQMMSFQDSKMLPGPIQEVLQRVQDRADYMPSWQRDRVLTSNLGADWRDLFYTFEEKPMAAASIGQVHRATLRSDGTEVAVKIQFPGVADSINSDLDNLGILLAATRLLPKGLYLNKTIDNARTELAWECDYEREAECGERYRELLADEDDVFAVPRIYPEACGKQVLTMEYMEGIGVTRVKSFTQEQRDWIGTHILRLCLREITEFRFMQTDPNWTNFLYNDGKKKLELLDFGASREYPERFITLYVRLLEAASRTDRQAVRDLSQELGYLTGHESKAMLDAHTSSVLTLAEPFLRSAPETYDFRDQTITERVKSLIPVMIRERLAPPPEETYSLHRKLSGAFLLCARLGSRVRCRELFEESLRNGAVSP